MAKWRRIAPVAAIGLAAVPAAALAQTQGSVTAASSPAQREALLEREKGVRLGSFTVIPSVTAEIAYDDNIYATDTAREDDIIATATPSIAIKSNSSNYSLNGYAFYSRNFHANKPSEDVSQFGALADGSYTIDRDTIFTASVRATHASESRRLLGTFRESSEPVQYTDLEGSVGATSRLGPIFVNGGLRIRRVSYDDTVIAGVNIDQKFRNFSILSGELGAGYNLGEMTRIVLNFEAEQRRYDLRPGDTGFDPLTATDRSANGYRITGGIQRELTALLTGTVRVGYFNFDYADTTLRDIHGFSYFGDLRWSVTPLTTFNLTAARRVDETVSPLSAGNLRDEVTVGALHELLRNLYLQGSVRGAKIRSTGTQPDSTEFALDATARYYFGRKFRLEFSYARSSRDSDDRSIAFKDNIFMLRLKITP